MSAALMDELPRIVLDGKKEVEKIFNENVKSKEQAARDWINIEYEMKVLLQLHAIKLHYA
jgi:hypothetical protein